MAKGPSFEREVCEKLSLWWTDGKRDDVFMRTSGSGGKATARRKKGKDTPFQGGDITFSDPIGAPLIEAFNIEAKSGYGSVTKTKRGVTKTNWCVLDLIDGTRTKHPEVFVEMWKQTTDEAFVSNRIPLLIFRRKQKRICIAMFSALYLILAEIYGHPLFKRVTVKTPGVVTIMSFDNFIAWCPNIRVILKEE